MKKNNNRITIRLDDDLYEQIETSAKNADETLSQYIRRRLSKKDKYNAKAHREHIASIKELVAMRNELNRIGNNLNQIARALNSNKKNVTSNAAVLEATKAVRNINKMIAKRYK